MYCREIRYGDLVKVKVITSPCLTKHRIMNTYEGVQTKLPSTVNFDTGWSYENQFHAPAALAVKIIPGTLCIGSWMGLVGGRFGENRTILLQPRMQIRFISGNTD